MSKTYRRNDTENAFRLRKQIARLEQEIITLEELASQMSDPLFAEEYNRQANDKRAEVRTLQRKLDG